METGDQPGTGKRLVGPHFCSKGAAWSAAFEDAGGGYFGVSTLLCTIGPTTRQPIRVTDNPNT